MCRVLLETKSSEKRIGYKIVRLSPKGRPISLTTGKRYMGKLPILTEENYYATESTYFMLPSTFHGLNYTPSHEGKTAAFVNLADAFSMVSPAWLDIAIYKVELSGDTYEASYIWHKCYAGTKIKFLKRIH